MDPLSEIIDIDIDMYFYIGILTQIRFQEKALLCVSMDPSIAITVSILYFKNFIAIDEFEAIKIITFLTHNIGWTVYNTKKRTRPHFVLLRSIADKKRVIQNFSVTWFMFKCLVSYAIAGSGTRCSLVPFDGA